MIEGVVEVHKGSKDEKGEVNGGGLRDGAAVSLHLCHMYLMRRRVSYRIHVDSEPSIEHVPI